MEESKIMATFNLNQGEEILRAVKYTAEAIVRSTIESKVQEALGVFETRLRDEAESIIVEILAAISYTQNETTVVATATKRIPK